jgi:hypothetical protein
MCATSHVGEMLIVVRVQELEDKANVKKRLTSFFKFRFEAFSLFLAHSYFSFTPPTHTTHLIFVTIHRNRNLNHLMACSLFQQRSRVSLSCLQLQFAILSVSSLTQRNATQRNATQRNATQRNATQRNARTTRNTHTHTRTHDTWRHQ